MGTNPRIGRRRARFGMFFMVIGIVTAMSAVLAGGAVADHDDPPDVDGNPKLCEGGIRIDAGDLDNNALPQTFDAASFSLQITAIQEKGGPGGAFVGITFVVTAGAVDSVVMKGGDGANVINGPWQVGEGASVQTPDNNGGQQAAISHIDFCPGTPEDTTTTTVEETTTTVEETTTTVEETTTTDSPATTQGGTTPSSGASPTEATVPSTPDSQSVASQGEADSLPTTGAGTNALVAIGLGLFLSGLGIVALDRMRMRATV